MRPPSTAKRQEDSRRSDVIGTHADHSDPIGPAVIPRWLVSITAKAPITADNIWRKKLARSDQYAEEIPSLRRLLALLRRAWQERQ